MSEPEMIPCVACINCGFAAKRTILATAEHPNRFYAEISAQERRDGIRFLSFKAMVHSNYPSSVGMEVACFRNKFDLGALVRERVKRGDIRQDDAAMEVLKATRPCDVSCKHIDGLTPKEHLVQIMYPELSNRIEADRKEFMTELEKQRQAFDVKMVERNEAFQKQIGSFGNKLLIAAVIIAAVQLFAAIVAMTHDSLFVRWWLGYPK